MKNIIVVCEAGITTSLLVQKLRQQAQQENVDYMIESKSIEEGLDFVKQKQVDAVLLGPQVHHKAAEYEKSTNARILKIAVNDYNNMNTLSMFDQLVEAFS